MNSSLFRPQSNTEAESNYAAAAVESACDEMKLKLKHLSAKTIFYHIEHWLYSSPHGGDFLHNLQREIQAGTEPQKLFKLITTVRNLQGKTMILPRPCRHSYAAFLP